MSKQLEVSNLSKILGMEIPSEVIEYLQSKFTALTQLQFNLMSLLGQGRRCIQVESQIRNGKSTAMILYMIWKTIRASQEASTSDRPMHLIIFPSSTFVENFSKKIQPFVEVLKSIGCEIVFEKEDRNISLTNPKTRFCLLTVQETIRMFRQERLFPNECQAFVLMDIEFIFSFDQTSNVHRLIEYLKHKAPELLSTGDFLLFTKEDSEEKGQLIKGWVGQSFVNLRIKKDIKSGIEEAGINETNKTSINKLVKAVFNQYFYMGTLNHCCSLLYLVEKFEMMPFGTLLVTDTIEDAYFFCMFYERSFLNPCKVYNPQHPITLKAYNLSLFNSGQCKVLITTKKFIEDYHKNSEQVSRIKGLRNIFFFKSSVSFGEYQSFLEILQGNQTFHVEGTSFDFNVLFLVPNERSLTTELEEEDGQEDFDEQKDMNTFTQTFFKLMSEQEQLYGQVLFQTMDVSQKDVELFTYRIDTLVSSLSKKNIKLYRMVEMQRLLLKSRKMKIYFQDHQKEKELILVKLNKLSKELKQHEVIIPRTTPSYLIPSFVQEENKQVARRAREQRENSLKNNSKANTPEARTMRTFQESSTRLPVDRNNTLSSHKLWKIKHRKIKKFQDRKKILKGIYS